jgi:O-antigen ligase
MFKSTLTVSLLAGLLLTLYAATTLFGGVLTEFALPWYALIALVAVVWGLKALLCRPVSVTWSPMHLPVALFAGYAVWRYAVSPIEYESRLEVFQIAVYVLVYFLVACNFYRSRDRISVVIALVVLAVVESVYGMWQHRTQTDMVLWLDRGEWYHGRGSGTYFCPNHLAGLLEMAFVILAARLLVSRGPNVTIQSTLVIKLYAAVAAGFVAMGLLATLSRGGWIATVAALLALLVGAEVTRVLSSRTVIATFLLAVVAAIAAWNVPHIRARVEQDVRLQWITAASDTPIQIVEGFSGRYPIWKATVKMIRDHPIFGTGPGTWSWFHLKYREPRLQIRPHYTHQDLLQLASDYGLVGTGLVVWALICFYHQAWRLARHADSSEQRSFALGAAAAVTAILVHSLGDFNLHIPSNALWMVTLMGLTVAQSVDDRSRERIELPSIGRILIGFTSLILAAGIAFIGTRLCLASRYTARGYDASQEFEWDEAQAWYQLALRRDSGHYETHAQMGDAYRIQSSQFERDEDGSERQRMAFLSVEAYRQSLALNPFQSDVMLRLANAYELAGDLTSALHTYNQALDVDPNNAFIWLRLGVFYHRIGEKDRAIAALQRSAKLNTIEPIAQQYLEEIANEPAATP